LSRERERERERETAKAAATTAADDDEDAAAVADRSINDVGLTSHRSLINVGRFGAGGGGGGLAPNAAPAIIPIIIKGPVWAPSLPILLSACR